MSVKVLLTATDISRALARVAHEILERNHGADNVVLVGVRTRGFPLAQRLQKIVEVFESRTVPVGELDVLAYRDDVGFGPSHSHTGVPHAARRSVVSTVSGRIAVDAPAESLAAESKQSMPNQLPVSITDRNVILVDDVLYTGRTIRAAMDALVDIGRPSSIQLAVLVDRGHRELPIRPDYVGKNIPSARDELVRVRLVETDGDDSVSIVDRHGDQGGDSE